ncbi:hypothetical protein CORC01_03412 [Colletotrichum orchidophilum]|uniref:Uncharacterized protein n=1 Tax=Colletotrichum orchidophilum TaxID=1209926 RepID=A0A1G4BIW3_9PEZI|nr:uncharacterized protein CORC01_03412 [Colletotrichum orchidophilum]OHF01379.1 hypothetical protein CORC01_03412 [Colletotrichum orchidophilum]
MAFSGAQILNNLQQLVRPTKHEWVGNLIPPKASVFPNIEMNQTKSPTTPLFRRQSQTRAPSRITASSVTG